MAGYAEFEGIGRLHRGVESAPEYDAAYEADEDNGTPGETRCWCPKPRPNFLEKSKHFVALKTSRVARAKGAGNPIKHITLRAEFAGMPKYLLILAARTPAMPAYFPLVDHS